MAKSVPNAFTLIELLVVIAIMGIVGAFALANYRTFGEDQDLKSAGLDIQSLLRQAQTNATANVKCDPSCVTCPSALWQVEFGLDNVNLKCQNISPLLSPTPTPTLKKTLKMPANITITNDCGATVGFFPVSGQINLGGSCTVTLQNSKTENTKSFTIEQGGSIHE